MLLRVPLACATVVLATACALTEAPPPGGTELIQLEVRNGSAVPVALTVSTDGGPIDGAVQPASVPPRTRAVVGFYVPNIEEWWITVDAKPLLGSRDFTGGPETVPAGIDIDIGGLVGYWCRAPCR